APDIMVFLGDRFAAVNLEQKITIIPDLIVEVLSPSNEDYDLTTKAQTYARLGVPHYWAVDPRRRALTEHVRQPAGEYSVRTVTAPEPFTPALFPELTLDLDRMLA
ncbi:MAG: Uma2 family endonuclease, partial [Chloroflexota bacterium]